VSYPIWWCLSAENQAKLMQFQWDNFGYYLEIPPLPVGSIENIESLEEIDKIIRKPPKSQKRIT